MTASASPDTLAELLRAAATHEATGLHHGDDFTSWQTHLRLSAQRGAALRARFDAAAPPHVGVLLENTPEFSYLLGGAALGAFVLVGLNTTRRGDALAADAALADCQVILADETTRHLLPDEGMGQAEVIDVGSADWQRMLSEFDGTSDDFGTVGPDDLMMLIFTSGTTGNPKAVRCTQRKFAVNGAMLAERFEIGATDVVYLAMPMFHSNAVIAGWSVALANGASVALRRRFSARGFLPDVRRYGVTFANYVGKPLHYILATDESADDRDNTLRIMYGNEASARDRVRFADRFDCRVIDGFGSTEGGVAVTRTPDTPADALGPLRAPNAVVDTDTGEPVPTGTVGEIVNASGPGLFSGYYRDEESTTERMRGGVYHTGDLGWVDEQGYLHFAGRLGDWLRVDGENLGTGPIERILLRHPGIRQVAVYGVPVEIGDEIEAVIVADALDPAEFGAFLQAQGDLGPKQWPHRIRIVGEMPETATFKTVKRHLRDDTTPPTWIRDGGVYRPTR